jgi:hypothetical protein
MIQQKSVIKIRLALLNPGSEKIRCVFSPLLLKVEPFSFVPFLLPYPRPLLRLGGLFPNHQFKQTEQKC